MCQSSTIMTTITISDLNSQSIPTPTDYIHVYVIKPRPPLLIFPHLSIQWQSNAAVAVGRHFVGHRPVWISSPGSSTWTRNELWEPPPPTRGIPSWGHYRGKSVCWAGLYWLLKQYTHTQLHTHFIMYCTHNYTITDTIQVTVHDVHIHFLMCIDTILL